MATRLFSIPSATDSGLGKVHLVAAQSKQEACLLLAENRVKAVFPSKEEVEETTGGKISENYNEHLQATIWHRAASYIVRQISDLGGQEAQPGVVAINHSEANPSQLQ